MQQQSDLKFPVLLNHFDEQYYSLADFQMFNVGRNLSADIPVTDPKCSREQFQIVQKNGVYFFGLAMIVLLAVIGTAIGLCVSVFSKTEDFALAMVPIIIIPQIILAGFINPVENLLKVLATLFISAYWGYGGTASLLEETTKEIVKMNDWNFFVPITALIIQLFILIVVSIIKLIREKC